MGSSAQKSQPRKSGRFVVAAFLGAALGSMAPAPAQARPAGDELKSIQSISKYCAVCWRNARLDPGCWNDCTQEVFCRLLQNIPPATWSSLLDTEGEERREFIRAIDAVKKRAQRSRRPADLDSEVLEDHRALASVDRSREREMVTRLGAEYLSPRQKHILGRSLDGWSVQEIAREMHLPPARVSDAKYKLIGKLQRLVHADDLSG